MKKYFVVADVHGFYTEMIEAINKEGFDIENPDHIFVSLGDLLDRGQEAEKCLDFVNSLPKDRKILIIGYSILNSKLVVPARKDSRKVPNNNIITIAIASLRFTNNGTI